MTRRKMSLFISLLNFKQMTSQEPISVPISNDSGPGASCLWCILEPKERLKKTVSFCRSQFPIIFLLPRHKCYTKMCTNSSDFTIRFTFTCTHWIITRKTTFFLLRNSRATSSLEMTDMHGLNIILSCDWLK